MRLSTLTLLLAVSLKAISAATQRGDMTPNEDIGEDKKALVIRDIDEALQKLRQISQDLSLAVKIEDEQALKQMVVQQVNNLVQVQIPLQLAKSRLGAGYNDTQCLITAGGCADEQVAKWCQKYIKPLKVQHVLADNQHIVINFLDKALIYDKVADEGNGNLAETITVKRIEDRVNVTVGNSPTVRYHYVDHTEPELALIRQRHPFSQKQPSLEL